MLLQENIFKIGGFGGLIVNSIGMYRVRGLLLCTSVSYMSTSDKIVNVEHLISKMTHKPIALRFWVRVWCLSCLCGCSSLDVAVTRAPPMTQQWYQSPVRRRV
ncbi:hypothetical protein MtrunA17_Chr7g0271311 [Medicago truncatula]|uniref:Uncharacterized protein n=1 Tax=Medicago truncatula TaxID=3880 RepID=A0A396H7C1_MEDTR|nr:hypothetical protein MtrunA17_Chr7g0271311 [Medicago truncatula]